MLQEIARFEPFSGLAPVTLRAIARHSRRVELPAGRWLVQRGRVLKGSHFLLRGRVRSVTPDRLIDAGSCVRQAIYPGPAGLMTLSGCEFLQVSETGLEIATLEGGGFATLNESEDCWQTRFLRSHLMTGLDPGLWQKVLSQLESVRFEAGDRIIREGDAGSSDRCYLLASGRVVVSSGGRALSELGPGSLFGEEALISGQPRNATVTAPEPAIVMVLSARHFQEFLTDVLNLGGFRQPSDARFSNARCAPLCIDSALGLHQRISQLDECTSYQFSSRSPALCALALFLARKRGLKAWVRERSEFS